MSDTAIARVYAIALFEAATAADTVAPTGDDLRGFVGALDESRPLADAVFNPQIAPEVKMRVLTQLTGDADRLAAGARAVLLEKGRLALVGRDDARLGSWRLGPPRQRPGNKAAANPLIAGSGAST